MFNKIQTNQLALLTSIVVVQWASLQTANSLAIDAKSNPSQKIEQQQEVVNSTTTAQPLESKSLSTSSNGNGEEFINRWDHRRPVWSLAHMVNSIKELDYRLTKGANAVEADVTFRRDGVPMYTYHGPPCDCWRHCHQQEDFNEYLRYVRQIAIEEPTGIGQNLSMLFLDLKLDYLDQNGKVKAGLELAKSITENLFTNESSNQTTTTLPKFNLILSVNHVTDIDLVRNFIHYLEINNSSQLMSRIGFDVGMNDDLQAIESMWRHFGGTINLWQGDGYTNCFSPFYNLERLSKAISRRDNSAGYPAKVYHWTIDLHDRIRESLMMGVDAIMTNHPERLLTVLQEPEIAHIYRLADRNDDPFKKLTRRSIGVRSGETARYQRSASVTSGGFFGSLIDVVSSWLNYVREIPFLSLPSRLLSRSSSSSTDYQLRRQQQQQQQSATKPSSNTQVSVVKMHNQPEYKLELTAGADKQQEHQILKPKHANDLERSATSTNGTEQAEEQPYDGPKWYTSLASNILVSMMKIALPVAP